MSNETASGSRGPIRLRCLGGASVPDEMAQSATRLSKLPAAAVSGLGPILRRCVLEPMTPELGQKLTQYCLGHELAEADLGHVVRVCRFLLRESCAANSTVEELESDTQALLGASAELVRLVVDEYEPLRLPIRRELVTDALMKHGNVLVDVDWRVDVLASDRHAMRLGAPVAVVTFAYRNADRSDRLTLQFTVEQLERLQHMFAALVQRTLHPMPERA